MNELIISSLAGNQYSIKGAVRELQGNKRAKMMLRSQLAYKSDGDSLIVETDKGIEYVASIMKLVATYINANIIYQ